MIKRKSLKELFFLFLEKKPLKACICFVSASYLVLFIFYFFQFSCFGNDCVKTTQEDWGQLGDFIGGLLNPTFASITLIVVVYTSLKQMSYIKSERDANDLKHALENINNELDKGFAFNAYASEANNVRDAIAKLARHYQNSTEFLFHPFDPNSIKIESIFNYQLGESLIKDILKNSPMLRVYILILEQCFVNSGKAAMSDYRVSMIGKIFKTDEEIAGFIYLINLMNYINSDDLIEFGNRDFENMHEFLEILLYVASPKRAGAMDKFIEAKKNKYKC